jgi:hypothetical protein
MSFKSRDLTVKLSGSGEGDCGGCTPTKQDCGACTATHADGGGGGCTQNTKECGKHSAMNCSATSTGPTGANAEGGTEGMEVSGGLLAQLRQQLQGALAGIG